MSDPIREQNPQIRPLGSRRDLIAVADLVELCFADNMDADGREYLRHIRRLAQYNSAYGLSGRNYAGGRLPMQGYVWEENGRIVGNITLIPFMYRDYRIFLIANVAVHPEFRRNGIARKLTLSGMNYSRSHGAKTVWLHVRDDNQAAQDLYRSIGFKEQTRRTTWLSEPLKSSFRRDLPDGYKISPPHGRDWEVLSRWIDQNYPKDVCWNFRLDKENFRPGFFPEFWRYLKGERVVHLAAYKNSQLIGSVVWEPTTLYADTLWIASNPEIEEQAIPLLLGGIRKWIPVSRPLAINFPAERSARSFEMSDFSLQNTLIWMEHSFESNQGGKSE